MSEEALGNKANIGAISARPIESLRQSAYSASTIAIAGVAAGAIDLGFNTVKALNAGTSVLRPWKGVAAALLGRKMQSFMVGTQWQLSDLGYTS